MDTTPICPNCRKPLDAGAPKGLCPACLMQGAFPTGTDPDGNSPRFTPPTVEELRAKFPQLEIIELIGQGGMGAVYKARQKELDRIVALKILPPDIGQDAAFAERFAREARALAKLNHPGIVTIHDFGRGDGLYFFLMEFVDGVNLRQLLHGGRISAREALAIVPQICDALQFAHDQGIVHRDIKPENILLDRRGKVKVADFGLAKLIANQNQSEEKPGGEPAKTTASLTDAGKVMGTPQYMSPEQIQAPGEVDHRADIYALGVVFYQMLTGELPGKKIEPPSKKVQIDVRLDEVVLRALEKKPELRYQQASVLKTQVETIMAEHEKPEAGNQKPEIKPASFIAAKWVSIAVGLLIFGYFLLNAFLHATHRLFSATAIVTLVAPSGNETPSGKFVTADLETIAKSPQIFDPVISNLNLTATFTTEYHFADISVQDIRQQLSERVFISQIPHTDSYQLTVVDNSPGQAVTIAREITRQLAALTKKFALPDGRIVQVTEPATLNPDLTKGDLLLNLTLGLALAVVLGRIFYGLFVMVIKWIGRARIKSSGSGGSAGSRFSRMVIDCCGMLMVFLLIVMALNIAHKRTLEQQQLERGALQDELSNKIATQLFDTRRIAYSSLTFEGVRNAPWEVIVHFSGLQSWHSPFNEPLAQPRNIQGDIVLDYKPPNEWNASGTGDLYGLSDVWHTATQGFPGWPNLTAGGVNIPYSLAQNNVTTNTPVSLPPDTKQISFGPVMERVLPMDEKGLTDLFDVDNDAVDLSPNPPNLTQGLALMTKPGLVINRDEQNQETVLIGMNGVVPEQFRNDQWDKLTDLTLLHALKTFPSPIRMQPGHFMTAPMHGNPPQTFLFKSATGKIGLLQITGFTDNPRGVKIRYKLLQNAPDEPQQAPGVPDAKLSESPKLQFLAWQDEWKTNQPGAARHPDGSAVTDAQELYWLNEILPAGCVKANPEQQFLTIWVSHPTFSTQDFAELLDGDGNPIQFGNLFYGSYAADGQVEGPGYGDLPFRCWKCWCFCSNDITNRPARLSFKLRYVVGPLEQTNELAGPNFNNPVLVLLLNGSLLNNVGQDAQGRAFVSITVGNKMASRLFGVEAIRKDGRHLYSSGSSNTGSMGFSVSNFFFDAPLADVAKFIIGTRPIRTVEWTNVALPNVLPPPVFQMRLADDKPSADAEPMSSITRNRFNGNTYTNILYVQKTVLLDQSALESAKAVTDNSGQPMIYVNFTKSGGEKFAEITRQNTKKRLAIIINGQLCEAPFILDEISGGAAQIVGGFSQAQAEAIAQQMNMTIARHR